MKTTVSLNFLLFLTLTVPAFAGVSVSSPGNGASVTSPFTLSAWSSTCSNQSVASMGYSLDNSSDTTIVAGTAVEAQVISGLGTHTLHVKSWGPKNAACVTDVTINVVAGSVSPIPSWATSVSGIQTLNWNESFDTASGGGSAWGWTALINSPSRSGNARGMAVSYANYGGERFYVSFGDDTSSMNFFYDTWVYLASPSTGIANLEMDMNQVMSNGQTVIYGFQCDGYSSTWDYTANTGTPWSPKDTWLHSKAYCNPRNWGTNTWHHVQISYSRDDSGNVTYHDVWLDGHEQPINATVPSAFALGWSPTLLTNLQVDGLGGGGTAVVYLDDLTVYRW
jgi:hypothetical protein